MSRNYKYNFADQVLIHAQRPDASACAEYDVWTGRMGRYVRRGAKGIALVDYSGDAPRLRYVFDVSDTARAEARARLSHGRWIARVLMLSPLRWMCTSALSRASALPSSLKL